ncbi:MAG: amino acid ABC transporter ATP-binding protein [Candidatus Micrarchaeia archaeon]|jgi:ABC-type polar amino acid transport system ATPase subunit
MADLICIEGISKNLGSKPVLSGLSFTLRAGEVATLIGQSGSGKTTLLRCISGLHRVDEGRIVLENKAAITPHSGEGELARFRQSVGYVFQDFHLWPHKTVLENVALAPTVAKGIPKEAAVAKALFLLSKLGLKDKADEYPASLSGGQKQRAAIARALAMEPKLLLLDEATSALDPELVARLALIVRNLASEGVAVLAVTHDMGFSADVSNRVLFMEDGKIAESGTPQEVLFSPKGAGTKKFIGACLARDGEGR